VRRRRRPDELETLRRALTEGRHVVNLDRLAEKLVDSELARRAMISAVTGRGHVPPRRRRSPPVVRTRR
jgi:hypothetical protein